MKKINKPSNIKESSSINKISHTQIGDFSKHQQKLYDNFKHNERQRKYYRSKKGKTTRKIYYDSDNAKILRAKYNKRYYEKKKQDLEDYKLLVSHLQL